MYFNQYLLLALSVDGNWGTWGVFFPCSILCGEGTKMRLRRCDNPSPAHGGDGCPGSPVDIQKCKLKECPSMSNINVYVNPFFVSYPCFLGVNNRSAFSEMFQSSLPG